MKRFFKNWDVTKYFRLAIGLIFIGAGIYNQDNIFIIFGIYLSLMPIFNIGCCSANKCKTELKEIKNKTEEIKYEEIH